MAILVHLARSWGIKVSFYLDDSLTRGDSQSETLQDHQCFGTLLQLAGFLLHEDKSVVKPTQIIEHLGFIINSISLTLSIPMKKIERIRHNLTLAVEDLRCRRRISVRKAARTIGLIVSSFPATCYGKAHYRTLEEAKKQALRGSFNYNKKFRWPRSCLAELTWWLSLPIPWSCPFSPPIPNTTLITDASLEGWGVIWDDKQIFGPWENTNEGLIDELELMTILLAVQEWPTRVPRPVIQLWCDNQVAVAYIKNMGGRIPRLNIIAKQIWSILEDKEAFMLASYVPSAENPADDLTRGVATKKHLLDVEVQLNPEIFAEIVHSGPFVPVIDWFASAVNAQLPCFFSWKVEPSAEGFDAFNFDWSNVVGYMFPPFTLLPRVIRKIIQDGAKVLLIHPNWEGAMWAPELRHLTVRRLKLPKNPKLLVYPNRPGLRHPFRSLTLSASWLDGAFSTQ